MQSVSNGFSVTEIPFFRRFKFEIPSSTEPGSGEKRRRFPNIFVELLTNPRCFGYYRFFQVLITSCDSNNLIFRVFVAY